MGRQRQESEFGQRGSQAHYEWLSADIVRTAIRRLGHLAAEYASGAEPKRSELAFLPDAGQADVPEYAVGSPSTRGRSKG